MTWLTDHAAPRHRALDRAELERLAAGVAGRRELWEHQIDWFSDKRMYGCLHRDDFVDVWAILWRPGNDTGWHDHDISAGAVHVVEGMISEHELRIGGPGRRSAYGEGETLSFDPSRIHRLTCDSKWAVTIHAYSTPLWRLGQYTLEDDGTLRRVSVTYADELRPLEDPRVSAASADGAPMWASPTVVAR